MNKAIKRIALILASLAVLLLAACSEPPPAPPTDTGEDIYLVKNGESSYSIAYGNTDEVQLFSNYAARLRGRILAEYYAPLERYEYTERRSERELLIGMTDRPLSQELIAAVNERAGDTGDHVWGYAYRDGALAFYANSELALELGKAELEKAIYRRDGVAVKDGTYVIGVKSREEYENELRGEVNLVITESSSLTSHHPNAALGICGRLSAESADLVLSLPSKIVMTGDLTVSGVTLANDCTVIANGYTLRIEESVAMTAGRLTVYGGTESGALNSDTNLILLGARYEDIFGGGNGTAVNGSTNIILGGNANAGDTIDDTDSSISTCLLYGGGRGGSVSGTTNITLSGNAVTKYIIGTGSGNAGARVGGTNITVNGGRVMNIIGASMDSPASGLTVNVTVNDGLIESIFGGCQGNPMEGNVTVALLGGDVSRRVYAGCYNGYSGGFTSDCYVKGAVTVIIGPSVNLNSGKELAATNSTDKGVYASSRRAEGAQQEIGTVIFLDGSYQAQKSEIGSQSWLFGICESYHLYEIICSKGGKVLPTDTQSEIAILPDEGYKCTLNGKEYLHTDAVFDNLYTLPISPSVTKLTVTFVKEG